MGRETPVPPPPRVGGSAHCFVSGCIYLDVNQFSESVTSCPCVVGGGRGLICWRKSAPPRLERCRLFSIMRLLLMWEGDIILPHPSTEGWWKRAPTPISHSLLSTVKVMNSADSSFDYCECGGGYLNRGGLLRANPRMSASGSTGRFTTENHVHPHSCGEQQNAPDPDFCSSKSTAGISLEGLQGSYHVLRLCGLFPHGSV